MGWGRSMNIHLEIHILRALRNQLYRGYFPLRAQFMPFLFRAVFPDPTSLGSVSSLCPPTSPSTCTPPEHWSMVMLLPGYVPAPLLHGKLFICCFITEPSKVEMHKIAFYCSGRWLDVSNFIWLNLTHGHMRYFVSY